MAPACVQITRVIFKNPKTYIHIYHFLFYTTNLSYTFLGNIKSKSKSKSWSGNAAVFFRLELQSYNGLRVHTHLYMYVTHNKNIYVTELYKKISMKFNLNIGTLNINLWQMCIQAYHWWLIGILLYSNLNLLVKSIYRFYNLNYNGCPQQKKSLNGV